jgi:hypothetical protein
MKANEFWAKTEIFYDLENQSASLKSELLNGRGWVSEYSNPLGIELWYKKIEGKEYRADEDLALRLEKAITEVP